MQDNYKNNNASVAQQLEAIAQSIVKLNKQEVQQAIVEIHKAYAEIEEIALQNNLSVLRAIVHWVTLNTELDNNEAQIIELLENDSYSNWIDILVAILDKNEQALLPILHESLTSPNWIVQPSAPILKDLAGWMSSINTDADTHRYNKSNQTNTEESAPVQAEVTDSIGSIIEEQSNKEIQANEDSLIEKTVFEKINISKFEKDFSAVDDDKNMETLIYSEQQNNSSSVIDIEAIDLNESLDKQLIEFGTEIIDESVTEKIEADNDVIDDSLFAKNDNLLASVANRDEAQTAINNNIEQQNPTEDSGLQLNWSDDTHPELLMVYLEETPTQIDELSSLLVKVFAQTADAEETKLASRLAHTIKGGSAIVGITALSEFAYRLETLLDYASEHELSEQAIALLPEAATCLEALFEAVQLQTNEPAGFNSLLKQLDEQVNSLAEFDDDEISLSAPVLPDFIQNSEEDSVKDISISEEILNDETAEDNSKDNKPETSPFQLNWDDDVHPELLMVYFDETPTQITELKILLNKISDGKANVEEKHTASRMAHTIKGSSALVGISALSEIAYRLETLLDHAIKNSLADEIKNLLPKSANCLEALFNAVQIQEPEPDEFYSIFKKLDNFVSTLEEDNQAFELSTPELPDFIQKQNEVENHSNQLDVEEVDETHIITTDDEPSIELEKLQSTEDIQNITVDIDDIVMNLVNITTKSKSIESSLDDYSTELQRFELISEISGYPELSLLSQWCQKNLELFAQNNTSEDRFFVSTGEIWNWIEFVSATLKDAEDMSHMSSLSAELIRTEWAQAIEAETLQTVLLSLRHLEASDSDDNEQSQANSNPNSNTNSDEVISWDQDIHPELLAVYFNETPEHINAVTQLLHKIVNGESSPEDNKKASRLAHTLKGSSGVIGLNALVDLTHYLEDILDYSIENQLPQDTAELLAEASDCMESLFENIQSKKQAPEEFSSILKKLMAFSKSIDRQKLKSDDHSHKNTQAQSQEVKTEAEISPSFKLTATTDVTPATKSVRPNTEINEAHLRVPIRVIDKLLNLAGELVTTSSQVGDKLEKALSTNKTSKKQEVRIHSMLDELSETINRQEKEQMHLFSSFDNSDFDSLEMDSYNELHSVASLLSETIFDSQEMDNRLTKQLNDLNESLLSLEKLNKDFSDVILRSRMESIETIVPRLERIVRQTCRKTGKKAELSVTGRNINIDTDILNALLDPLLHMLRNSIDHGIEKPEDRAKKSKNETGLIELSFVREANNIIMSLQDDGAGLDPEIIYQKAIHKNIITPEQEFNKNETLKLILSPGFSTQEIITDVSGRGIGMDVVNTSVEQLNGSLNIESELGHGTRFNMTIPLTLITNTTLMVKVAGNIVAVPTDTIEQIIYQQANSVISRNGSYFVAYNDDEIEIKTLRQLLNWSNEAVDFKQSFSVLMIKNDKDIHAIHIDSILSSRQVVVKPLSPWILPERGVIGACHLNDGGVAPVINLSNVVKNIDPSQLTPQTTLEKIVEQSTPQILIVDDSLSNRKALSLIIDRTSYDVVTAVDGLDALQIMNENKIDLVFTDLEMPRMNGLELTQAIRAWTDKKETPIVMITSRTTTKHRALANKAGVNDYLTKPVATETLLASIKQWLQQTETIGA